MRDSISSPIAFSISKLGPAVEDEGDRTVVDALHFHARAENAGLDREVGGFAQGLDELLE